jgi:hypothetical protein
MSAGMLCGGQGLRPVSMSADNYLPKYRVQHEGTSIPDAPLETKKLGITGITRFSFVLKHALRSL